MRSLRSIVHVHRAWFAVVLLACESRAPSAPSAQAVPYELAEAACDGHVPILRSLLATHSACAHDGDCTVLGPFCPFGCAVPVSRVGAPEVRAAFAHVEQRCAADMCRYRCGTERPHACCSAGRCRLCSER